MEDEINRYCEIVYGEMGGGMREKVYQNALNILLLEHHKTILEYPISINFMGHCCSICYPDILLVRNGEKILIEIKAVGKLTIKDHQQLKGYMKHSGIDRGFLINFGNHRLEVVYCDNNVRTVRNNKKK